MKLTWHPTHKLWCKVIGKRIAKDGKRLVQAQWYFSSNREQSEADAASIKQDWQQLKRTWLQSHKPWLETMGEPFPDVPHWYVGRAEPSKDIDWTAVRAERDATVPDDVAEMHAGMTLGELQTHYLAYRKEREGVDFKPATNKTFESDLRAAFRFADGGAAAALLPASEIGQMRAKMIRAKTKRRTMRNFAVAYKAMLVWYWKSHYFKGGVPNGDFDAEFAKFPKLRAAKPKHLSTDALKEIFALAKGRRRLFVMLMLNTGMQPTDIAAMPVSGQAVDQDGGQPQFIGFDLDGGTVHWQRQKLQRIDEPSDVVVVSKLWPETVQLVRRYIAKSGLAFRNKDGGPLAKVTAGRNRNNAITKSLNKLWKRLKLKGVTANVKSLRSTGAQLIHEASDYDLSRVWLGRGFAQVDKAYLSHVYAKLDAASGAVRQKLIAAGVLPGQSAG